MVGAKHWRVLLSVVLLFAILYLLTPSPRPSSHSESRSSHPDARDVEDENADLRKTFQREIIRREHATPKETVDKETKLKGDEFFENSMLRQNDSKLLDYIRKKHLTPPSMEPYNLEDPTGNPSAFIPEITKLFGSRRNGIFVECGANDGEYLSNTLALERDMGWTGLLIEADHLLLPKLYGKNRKSWIADACVSFKAYPQKVRFIHNTGTEYPWLKAIGIIEPSGLGNPETAQFKAMKDSYQYTGDSECFPMFSILSAANLTVIDYLTLDVEGLEFKILKKIPFDSITIKVISVEFHLIPEGKDALMHFMRTKGYRQVLQSDREWFFILKKFAHEFPGLHEKINEIMYH